MGLADTIRDTLGVGHSAEAAHGDVDRHTPGAFPSDTPMSEEQRELGSQSHTTGLVGGKEGGIRGHEHRDSGVGLSDVSGSHPKTVGQSDLSSSGLTSGNNTTKLSDVTHSRPQTVEKGGLHNTAAGNTGVSSGLSDVTHSHPTTVGQGSTHNTAASNTGVSSGLSDVTQSHPKTVGNDSIRNTAAGNTTGLTDDDYSHSQASIEKGALQSHRHTGGHHQGVGDHFHRSDVHMPTDSASRGPSENADHGSAAGNALASVLGEPNNPNAGYKAHPHRDDDDGKSAAPGGGSHHTTTTTTTTSAPGGVDSSSHNIVSNGKGNTSHTDNKETYWGSLPAAAGVYNTVTGNGSGEDTTTHHRHVPSSGVYNTVTGSGSGEDATSQHRHVPAAGDSEVAMQAAGHSPDAHVPRGAGVYNTVVGHGSDADAASRAQGPSSAAIATSSSSAQEPSSSGGLYNTLSGAAAGGYSAAASAAQGLYNTISHRSGSGTEQQYEPDKPLTTTTSRPDASAADAGSSGHQGYAAGAYNTVANAAQGVSDTVTGRGGAEHRTTGHESATGTQRAFPLDNSSPTTTLNNRALAADGGHHDSHAGRNLAGAGAGAAAGAGVYDFLHRKDTDAPDPKNEFVSNVNPYNAPTHEGWQHVESGGLFSNSELKRLSLRQKEMGYEDASASHGDGLVSSGTGQTHDLGSGHRSYDTPASLAASGSQKPSQVSRGGEDQLASGGRGQTHGLGSSSSGADRAEIPVSSRAHQNYPTTSLDDQRSEAPRSSDHQSNVGAGLAGAGVGAGAAYGASRLARDHHDDKHSATSRIPTASSSTSRQQQQQQQPMGSTANRFVPTTASTHRDTPPGNGGLPLPTPKRDTRDKHDAHVRHPDDNNKGEHSHKARNVAAFGAGGAAAAGGYDMLSHGDKPSGVRQPGQSTADVSTGAAAPVSSTTTTTTTSPTSLLDEHQRSRAAAGMTGMGPTTTGTTTSTAAGVGASTAAAASGMSQQGVRQQQQQDTLSRAGGDGHAPLHSSLGKNLKERGTTVPSASAGKKDPYNHLSSGTPSGVSME